MSSYRPKISAPAFHVPFCHLQGHISVSDYEKFNLQKSKQRKGGSTPSTSCLLRRELFSPGNNHVPVFPQPH